MSANLNIATLLYYTHAVPLPAMVGAPIQSHRLVYTTDVLYCTWAALGQHLAGGWVQSGRRALKHLELLCLSQAPSASSVLALLSRGQSMHAGTNYRWLSFFSANGTNQTRCPLLTVYQLLLPSMLFQYSLAFLFLFLFFLDFCWYLLLSLRGFAIFCLFCLTQFSFVIYFCRLFLCFLFLLFPFNLRVFRLGFLFFYLDINIWRILVLLCILFWDWYVLFSLLPAVCFDTGSSTARTSQFECREAQSANHSSQLPNKKTHNFKDD